MYDLIIIGGGPAGVAAGIYSARQKVKTLLLVKSFGGQIAKKAVAIENYPGFDKISGLDLIKKFEEHLKKQVIEIQQEEVIRVQKKADIFSVFTNSGKKIETRALIVASGANPLSLKVPGEKEFLGKGVSYCSTCDAPIFANKTVAVVGGGNSGFEAAIVLADYAKKIYILEYGPQVKADGSNQENAKKTGKVEIITQALVKEIRGEQFVSSLIYQGEKTEKEINLPVEGVMIEIGSHPAASFIRDLVDFNERNEIKIDLRTCQTKTQGIFAAGDVTEIRDKQIVVAAGEGVKAFLSAYNYLRKQKK